MLTFGNITADRSTRRNSPEAAAASRTGPTARRRLASRPLRQGQPPGGCMRSPPLRGGAALWRGPRVGGLGGRGLVGERIAELLNSAVLSASPVGMATRGRRPRRLPCRRRGARPGCVVGLERARGSAEHRHVHATTSVLVRREQWAPGASPEPFSCYQQQGRALTARQALPTRKEGALTCGAASGAWPSGRGG